MTFLTNIAKDDVYENTLIPLKIDIVFNISEFDSMSAAYGLGETATKSIPTGLIPVAFSQPRFSETANINLNTISYSSYFEWTEVYPFTATPSFREWSFDRENSIIYLKSIPRFVDFFKITCIFPISVRPITWYLDPKDSTSKMVKYLPYINSDISVKSSQKDRLESSSPIFSGGFSVNNSDGFLDKILDVVHTKGNNCDVYRISGNPSVGNTNKIVSFILDDLNVSGEIVNFSATQNELQQKMVTVIEDYEDINLFELFSLDLDLDRSSEKLRFIFGHVRGVKLLPLNWDGVTASTSSNRQWLAGCVFTDTDTSVSSASATLNSGKTVISGSVLNDSQGKIKYRLGDRIRVVQGAFTSYSIISAVNLATPSITLSSALSADFSAGSINVDRPMCSRVFINQSGTSTELMPFRDYTTTTYQIDTFYYRQIVLTTSAESNVGISTMNAGASPDSFVVAHVYGPRFDSISIPIGSTNIKSHLNLPAIAHPVAVIYLILSIIAEVPDDDIDLVSFEAMLNYEPTNQSPVSFSEPPTPTTNPSKISDIIRGIAQSYDLLVFKNNENKWKVVRNAAAASKTWIVRKKDIIGNALNYEHDYQRICQTVTVSYDINNNPALSGETLGYLTYTAYTGLGFPIYGDVTAKSLVSYAAPYSYSQASAVPTHNIGTTGPYKVAENIANLDNYRKIVYKVRLRKAFLPVDYGDKITLSLERISGFEYVKATERQVDCRVLSITRSLNFIDLELEDSRYESLIGYDSDTYI